MLKGLTLLLLLVLATAGFFTLYTDYQDSHGNQSRMNSNAVEDACSYGDLPKELYLETYEVKSGDTLLSIANTQLGSTSRINEIINLNRDIPEFNSLYKNNEIQVGWQLYLSAKYLPANSGDLVAEKGKLVVKETSKSYRKTLVITHPDSFPTGYPTRFNDSSFFFGTQTFKHGDCVVIIRDSVTDIDIVLGLQSAITQEKKPEVLFKLSDINLQVEGNPCTYQFYGPEEVMRTYIVESGDSLSSIALEQLGDATRAKEIIEANKDRYPNLKYSNFVEIGWELLLPPKWAAKSTGYITAFAGTLLSSTKNEFVVAQDLNDRAHLGYSNNPNVQYFGKDQFTRGDCVVVLNNRGTALGIAGQDVDYINLFKYGK